MSAAPLPSEIAARDGGANRLASMLRWLGTGAVAASGVIFLLQGLEDISAVVRHWSYLLLMALVTGCGVGTRTLLGDAKSARLLLGLAVALVPVQFAELGGMIHGLAADGAAPAEPADAARAIAVAAATFVLAPLATFAGLAVLVRRAAGPGTWWFLLSNVVLLLPWRDSLGGYLVLALLGTLALIVDHRLSAVDHRFRTPEGRAVRAMFLVPAAIAAVRLGFHVQAFTGYCALAGFAAAAIVYIARHLVVQKPVQEVMYLAGAGLAALATAVWIGIEIDGSHFEAAAMLIPAAMILLGVGRLSAFGEMYRSFAALVIVLAAVTLLAADGSTGTVAALAIGALLLIYGCLSREREPVIAGCLTAAGAVVVLAVETLRHVDVNGWIALAVSGVLLVVTASVVERHGRALVRAASEGWTTVNEWR